MILSYLYEQKITSKDFILSQLQFEKKMYERINKQCVPLQQKQSINTINYHECAKKFKQKIKHFGLLTQLLIDQRKKELKKQCELKCKILKNQDQILNCVNQITKNKLDKVYFQDYQFLNIVREQLIKSEI